MLLRAAFWIALVSLLMPREPDLGLGRPGAHGLAADALSWASLAAPYGVLPCDGNKAVCDTGLGILKSLRADTLRRLAQVKADIEAQQRARSRAI
jgi:hypothetical protein